MRNILLGVGLELIAVSCLTILSQSQISRPINKQFEISDCTVPYQANVSGATYTVTRDLPFSPGDCIDVTASGVTINLNGHSLGATPCSCAGVSISKDARGVHVFGGSIIGRSLQFGIHDMGDLALIEKVTVVAASFGISLDGVKGSIVRGANVSGPQVVVGINLTDTDHCVVENSVANQNGEHGGGTGIFVGNSGLAPLSRDNFIVGNEASHNDKWGIKIGGSKNVVVSNTAIGNSNDDGTQGEGIFVVQNGNPGPADHNLIMNNSASQNGLDDAYDTNPQCGTNRWVLDDFATRNQNCIH